jgi:hypothetical protein
MRDIKTRKADVMAALEAQKDAWIASAEGGRPHLICASAWWDGAVIVMATVASSRTGRNLAAGRTATIGLGSPDDAVLIEARLEDVQPAAEAPRIAAGFAAALGWDPREAGVGWSFYRLRPVSIQAYRGYDEQLGDKYVMRDSKWLA